MYHVGVKESFIAQHKLIGGDFGKENYPHSHAFEIEVEVSGHDLANHGYLVDIDEMRKGLSSCIEYFTDQMLNDLKEFSGLNPSVEHFCRIFCERFLTQIRIDHLAKISVCLFEDKSAWATYTKEF